MQPPCCQLFSDALGQVQKSTATTGQPTGEWLHCQTSALIESSSTDTILLTRVPESIPRRQNPPGANSSFFWSKTEERFNEKRFAVILGRKNVATVESRRHQCLNEEFPGNSALAIPHRYSDSLRVSMWL